MPEACAPVNLLNSFLLIVNEKAVATDEVYYATEKGQLFDCDYRNMNMFRAGTLYSLLAKVPSTIGRMARPNNIIDRARRDRRSRDQSGLGGKSGMRADGSVNDGSQLSGRGGKGPNLQRRGTVNLVKNFMFNKI